jgi:hypothetical protein
LIRLRGKLHALIMFRVALGKPNCDVDKFSPGLTEAHASPHRLQVSWACSVTVSRRDEGVRLALPIEMDIRS